VENLPPSSFISVGGLRLHYVEWNSNAPRALVLLHDLGESADVWRPVAGELARTFRVIAVDMRGHGDSDWIDTYSPQEQGDDIGELIEALRLGSASVVGTGMGGRAAALLAARQEHRLDRIVIVESGVQMYLPAEREADEAVLNMPRVYDSPEDYLRQWCAMRATLSLRHSATPPDDPATSTATARLLRNLPAGGFAPKCDLDGYHSYRAWSPGERTISYHDEFYEITTPTLLVRGAESTVLSPEHADETVESIPGCRLAVIEGARHDVLADAPDAVLAAIMPFLHEHS
jgi:pimeloyl-ACP methyl ester carboxylesterase